MTEDYDAMSMSELFSVFRSNWQALSTSINMILGDEPMPDPRVIAETLANVPEDIWVSMFKDEQARAHLSQNMDLQSAMSDIQVELVAITKSALSRPIQA